METITKYPAGSIITLLFSIGPPRKMGLTMKNQTFLTIKSGRFYSSSTNPEHAHYIQIISQSFPIYKSLSPVYLDLLVVKQP